MQSENKRKAIYLSKAQHKVETTIYQSAERAFQKKKTYAKELTSLGM